MNRTHTPFTANFTSPQAARAMSRRAVLSAATHPFHRLETPWI